MYSVIIKTHNSEKFFPKCIASLQAQTLQPSQIIVVDSASVSTDYLTRVSHTLSAKLNNLTQHLVHLHPRFCEPYPFTILCTPEDIGFCKGNNLGYQYVDSKSQYVLFLNPDAFPFKSSCEKIITFLEQNPHLGAATGSLLGYSIEKDQPTGLYDSTGIHRTFYGFWKDQNQGEKINPIPQQEIPAICGAFFFAKKKALDSVLLHNQVFDENFYMFKEDIDLSLRLRKKGWKLALLPQAKIYHCRGWNPDRKKVSRKNRLLSSRNDIRIDLKNRSPYLPVSVLKYLLVKYLDF